MTTATCTKRTARSTWPIGLYKPKFRASTFTLAQMVRGLDGPRRENQFDFENDFEKENDFENENVFEYENGFENEN